MARSFRARLVALPAALLLMALVSFLGLVYAGRYEEPLPGKGKELVEGEYIVLFDDDEPDPKGKAHGLEMKYQLFRTDENWELIKGFAFRAPKGKEDTPRGIAMKIAGEPGVAVVEPVQLMTLDPINAVPVGGMRHVQHRRLLAEEVPTGVRRIEAAMPSPAPPFGTAAVLDTGVDLKHPDLNIHPSRGKSFVPGSGNAQDGNGHGTHCSGIIGAIGGNGFGVVGVAPGATILPLKVLNNRGSGSYTGIINALQWVAANANDPYYNIKVVSMSLGGGASTALDNAVDSLVKAGIPVVVAAGNDNSDFSGTSPARAANALTVTAIADADGAPGALRGSTDDVPASFSNFCQAGSNHISHTIAAPGVNIISTWRGGTYATASGTSMACPHVAGLVLRCRRAGAPCSEVPALEVGKTLINLAMAAPASKGFLGDPRVAAASPTDPYYGYLPIAACFVDPPVPV